MAKRQSEKYPEPWAPLESRVPHSEDGILGDVEAVVTNLAKCMETSRAAVNRLLDPNNPSVTLQALKRTAAILGKKLCLELTPHE